MTIGLSLDVVDFDVVFRESEHLSCNVVTDLLGLSPVLQVHVVGKYSDLMW